MAADFSIAAQADHLRVEVTGDRGSDAYVKEMLAGWSRVAEECRAKDIRRVLAINRLTGRAPSGEAYRIAAAIPPLFQGASVRMAQVVVGDEDSKQANRFAEDVAVNRGFDARMFGDEGAALAWLLSGPARGAS